MDEGDLLLSPGTLGGFFIGTAFGSGPTSGGTAGVDAQRRADAQVLDLVPDEAFKAQALLRGVGPVGLASEDLSAIRRFGEVGLLDAIGDIANSVGGVLTSIGSSAVEILGDIGDDVVEAAKEVGTEVISRIPDLAQGELRSLFGLDQAVSGTATKPMAMMTGAGGAGNGNLSPRAAQIREQLRRTAPRLCGLSNAQFEALARGDRTAAALSLENAICLDVNTSAESRARFNQAVLAGGLPDGEMALDDTMSGFSVVPGRQAAAILSPAVIGGAVRAIGTAAAFVGVDRAIDAGVDLLSDLVSDSPAAAARQATPIAAGRSMSTMAAVPPLVIDLSQVPGSDGFTFPRVVLITNAGGVQRDYKWPGKAVVRSGDISARKRVDKLASKARRPRPRKPKQPDVLALPAPRVVTVCNECRSAPCHCGG